MDDVARLPKSDRADLFQAAASMRGNILPTVIEKDFWVCWTLKRVFALKTPPAGLIFKGGTSLSKAFQAIERFSEDVDLSFDRDALGFGGANDPANAVSRKKADNQLDALIAACVKMIREEFLPQLRREFTKTLGTEPSGGTWDLALDPSDDQTLIFDYPRAIPQADKAVPYSPPAVRLELGARGEKWPAQEAIITPYAAQSIPEPFRSPSYSVKVMSAERTFWEKATILHVLYHLPKEKPFPERQSRHYYDLAQLYEKGIGKLAVKDFGLLKSVVDHKNVFFRSAAAKYADAVPGTLRLTPHESRMKELTADYAKMGEMIFGEPPKLERILASVQVMEDAINGGTKAKA